MKSKNERSYEEAIWHCPGCAVWWAGQTYVKPTNLLRTIPPALQKQLPWDEFRGWRIKKPATCPTCKRRQKRPVYGRQKTQVTAGG